MKENKYGQERNGVSEEMVRFFYLSFRYSQGSAELQDEIFNWVASSNLFQKPPLEIPEVVLSRLKTPKKHNTDLSSYDARTTFVSEWKALGRAFEVAGNQPNVYMSTIAELMIKRDLRFIEIGRDNSSQDSYASYVRRYIIFGKPSGNPIFDKLFLELKNKLIPNKLGIGAELKSLGSLWEEKHPGYKFIQDSEVV